MRGLAAAAFAVLAGVAVSGAGSSPAASPTGRIVFASGRPIPGQPAGDEIYSLDVASGHIRDLSRSSDDDRALALSPDGRWIAFVRLHLDKSALWVMRSDGTGQHRVSNLEVFDAEPDQEIAWSPDGSTIAFSAFEPPDSARLWTVKADGTGLRRLTKIFAVTPSWSPNGAEIAFSGEDEGGSRRIGLIAPDSGGVRWLTGPGAFADTQPSWSHDGKQLAFVRTIACEPSCGSTNVFAMNADGSGERQVTPFVNSTYPPVPLEGPAWSPNGRLIVFIHGAGGHVDLIRVDGTGLRTLGKHANPVASWSPSGKYVAFAQQRGTGLRLWRLTVSPLRGRARRYPLEGPSTPVWAGPYWARGGKALVYSSVSTDTDFELFSSDPNGKGLRRLTHDRVEELQPAWSPDGRRIAYVRGKFDREGRLVRGSLYLMNADGGHVRRLTRGPLDTGPSWAPGGKRIVFVRHYGLHLLDLRTGRIRSLGAFAESAPAWSPDGRLIAFGADTELETIRPDGKGEHTVFDGGNHDVPAQIGRPSWSPDGHSIAFDLLYDHGRWVEESETIVSRSGQQQRSLNCYPSGPPFGEPEFYEAGNVKLAWSPDAQWLVVDGLAVCRVDGSGGYWLRAGDDPSWRP